jgi:hypothetical protein
VIKNVEKKKKKGKPILIVVSNSCLVQGPLFQDSADKNGCLSSQFYIVNKILK